jgi:hypothetical protein
MNPWKQAWHDFREGTAFMLLEWALRCAPAPLSTDLAQCLAGKVAAPLIGAAPEMAALLLRTATGPILRPEVAEKLAEDAAAILKKAGVL